MSSLPPTPGSLSPRRAARRTGKSCLPSMMRRGRGSRHYGTISNKGHQMINEGDRAPSIAVTATDGTKLDLGSPGQPLVLYFYPKDDTSGCTREAQDFTTLAADYAKAGVKVVGVS